MLVPNLDRTFCLTEHEVIILKVYSVHTAQVRVGYEIKDFN